MEILGFIPARGGSKGIPNKNITDLCGKPLIDYTYDAVEQSTKISRCILSTDSLLIANTAKGRNIEVLERPKELSEDYSKTSDVILDVLNKLKDTENYQPDYILILQPTSPLRTGDDIDKCIDLLLSNKSIDSVISVQEAPHNFIPEKIMYLDNNLLYPYKENMSMYTTRQEMPQYFGRNGAAIYAFKTEVFLKTGSYYGDVCLPYIMSREKSVDIDTPLDLEMAEWIMRKGKNGD